MAIIKNSVNKLKTTAKRMVGAKELERGFRENYSALRELCNYNLKKFSPPSDHFSMPTAEFLKVQQGYKKTFFLFVFLFCFAVLYTLLTLIKHHWLLAFVNLNFTLLCAAFMFRYHFWLYQMKRKTLGCTFGQWYEDEIKARFNRPSNKKNGGAAK